MLFAHVTAFCRKNAAFGFSLHTKQKYDSLHSKRIVFVPDVLNFFYVAIVASRSAFKTQRICDNKYISLTIWNCCKKRLFAEMFQVFVYVIFYGILRSDYLHRFSVVTHFFNNATEFFKRRFVYGIHVR